MPAHTSKWLYPTFLIFGAFGLFGFTVYGANYYYQVSLLLSLNFIVIYFISLAGSKLIRSDQLPNLDYIQSGESSLIILTICICLRTGNDTIFFLIGCSFIIVLLANLFIKHVIAPNKKESIILGISIHIIIALIIYFLINKDYYFRFDYIKKAACGQLLTNTSAFNIIIPLSLTLLIVIVLLTILKYSFRSFAFGKQLVRYSNWNFHILSLLISVLRSLTIAVSVVMLGLIGGIGVYLVMTTTRRYRKIIAASILNIYMFFLFIMFNKFSWYYIPIASFVISYIVFFVVSYIRKNIYAPHS